MRLTEIPPSHTPHPTQDRALAHVKLMASLQVNASSAFTFTSSVLRCVSCNLPLSTYAHILCHTHALCQYIVTSTPPAQTARCAAPCLAGGVIITNALAQAAQRAADDIAAISTRARPPVADAIAAAADVSLDSDVDWSKFAVLKESVAYSRYLQVRATSLLLKSSPNLHSFPSGPKRACSNYVTPRRCSQVNSRSIRYPDGSTHDFDVCVKRQPKATAGTASDASAACGLFVCVLPYFSADRTVTLIRCDLFGATHQSPAPIILTAHSHREFAQGPVSPLISCCVGGVDLSKHAGDAPLPPSSFNQKNNEDTQRLLQTLPPPPPQKCVKKRT
jgi:hypothetical protein